MEKGEFGEKEELLQRLSRAELECTKLSEEVVRLRDADRRCQVGHTRASESPEPSRPL